jgi:hypothetical protein
MNNELQAEFRRVLHAGTARDFAIMKGGTGELRKELTSKERASRKAKRKQVKASRKGNR